MSGGGTDYVDSGGTVDQPEGVAIDKGADRLYWANSGDNAHPIAWTTLSNGVDGGNLSVNGATASGASALALDTSAGIVYWTNFNDNTVSYAHLDGSGGGQLDTTGASLDGPIGIAVDAVHHVLVVTSQNNNTVSLISIGATTGGSDLLSGGALESSPMYPALYEPPYDSAAPQITGTALPGAKLSCSQGTWAGDDLGGLVYRAATSFAYQWTRDGANIGGATTSKLVLSAGDAGKEIACRVTATNGAGSTPESSDPVTPGAYGTATKIVLVPGVSTLVSGAQEDVSFRVEDAYGNTVLAPHSITFTKAAGSGTVTGLGTVSSSSGVATQSVTGVLAGPVRIAATGAGLKSAVATLTVVPGAAAKLAFFTPYVEIKQGLSFRMRVFVEDAAGNTVTSANPLIAFTSRGSAVVTGLASTKASKGVATVTLTAKRLGTKWIQANAYGLTPDMTKFVVFK